MDGTTVRLRHPRRLKPAATKNKNPPIPPLGKGGKGGFEITERDKKVMLGIAHQVSTALEQARLYKETTDKSMELSHKIETIQVMNEIEHSFNS